jgi:histidinol-phosphatase (PHP family)
MKQKITRDGHIHTPYCPHGSADVYEQYIGKILDGKARGITETKDGAVPAFRPYVETAIRRGLKEISFTEHMPFPCYFLDDRKYQDCCALQKDLMPDYFSDIGKIRSEYRGRIEIHTGLEVDFLDGYEEKTAELLDQYGTELTDGILSVHFVRIGNKIYDIDVRDGFEEVQMS